MPVTLPSIQGKVPQEVLTSFRQLTAAANAAEAHVGQLQRENAAQATTIHQQAATLRALQDLVNQINRRVAALEAAP